MSPPEQIRYEKKEAKSIPLTHKYMLPCLIQSLLLMWFQEGFHWLNCTSNIKCNTMLCCLFVWLFLLLFMGGGGGGYRGRGRMVVPITTKVQSSNRGFILVFTLLIIWTKYKLSNTTDGTSGAGTAYPSCAHEFTSSFYCGSCCAIFSFLSDVV
jgi:hypothetical protein